MYLGKLVELAAGRRPVRDAVATRTRSPCCRPSRDRPAQAQEAHRAQGRRPVAGGAAVGLPLPHALLAARAARQPGALRRPRSRCSATSDPASRPPATTAKRSPRRRSRSSAGLRTTWPPRSRRRTEPSTPRVAIPFRGDVRSASGRPSVTACSRPGATATRACCGPSRPARSCPGSNGAAAAGSPGTRSRARCCAWPSSRDPAVPGRDRRARPVARRARRHLDRAGRLRLVGPAPRGLSAQVGLRARRHLPELDPLRRASIYRLTDTNPPDGLRARCRVPARPATRSGSMSCTASRTRPMGRPGRSSLVKLDTRGRSRLPGHARLQLSRASRDPRPPGMARCPARDRRGRLRQRPEPGAIAGADPRPRPPPHRRPRRPNRP